MVPTARLQAVAISDGVDKFDSLPADNFADAREADAANDARQLLPEAARDGEKEFVVFATMQGERSSIESATL